MKIKSALTIVFALVAACLAACMAPALQAEDAERNPVRRIVLIAGPESHGPEGNGYHDYAWSVRLLAVMLRNSNVADKVEVATFFKGWPEDQTALEKADTIVIISDGRDGSIGREALHLETPERLEFVRKQMDRGCGLVTFHFAVFGPEAYRDDMLEWSGGYFQWEQNGERNWYSAINTIKADVKLPSTDHPICRGVQPFNLRDEYYYNIRFPADGSTQPILDVPALNGRAGDGNVVAWARERDNGGRGFGTSCGHFYDAWENEQFRKVILNAIAWTAKVEIPEQGIVADYFTHEEIKQAENR